MVTFHITPTAKHLCLWNGAPLCWTPGLISVVLAEDTLSTAASHDYVSSSKTTYCNRTVHIHGVCIYIYICSHCRGKTITLSSSRSLPRCKVFSNLTHGFPLTLLADVEFLLRLSQDDRRLRGLGGRAEVCAKRTMRGERHTLMVESSLADSSSSWSAGLNATEFTTSSCASRARQML